MAIALIRIFVLISALVFSNTALTSEFDMVKVPTGQLTPFWLAPKATKDKRSSQVRPIKVPKFKSMVYPVTKKQYQNFLDRMPIWKRENAPSLFIDSYYLRNFINHTEEKPITEISWYAARAFCEFYGMRLPTVVEWEYMAAASERKKDANREEVFLRRILDWYGEPKGGDHKTVGSIYKNLYGIWDLHGLVWEWVEDFNSSFITGESREDQSFNKDMFCGAGGLSNSDKENYAAFMRFAFRSSLRGNSSVWNLGFRCVK